MLNKIQFIGHLGRDPESRTMPNGTAVCAFSVASTEKWKDKEGNKQESTEWLRCQAFDKLADICAQYLVKGSLVYVEGSLRARKYLDKDGMEKQITECRLMSMKMLGGAPERAPAPPPRPAPPPARAAPPDGFDDDIPF